jgi:hypothetical protein
LVSDETSEKSLPPDDIATATPLILALCDERATPDQIAQLERLIRQNPAVRKLYFRMMQLHAGLHFYGSALGVNESGDDPGSPSGSAGFGSRARDFQKQILSSIRSTMTPSGAQPAGDEPSNFGRPVNFVWRIGLALAAILLLALALSKPWSWRNAHQGAGAGNSSQPGLADLNSPTVTAVAGAGSTFQSRQRIPTNQLFELQHQDVQLQLPGGGRVTIAAPSQFKLDSGSELFLTHGSAESRIPGGGFVVRTPTAVVTDLGTEFGVSVASSGATHVDVFEGKVAVTPANPSASAPAGLLLSAGQAASITAAAISMDSAGAIAQRFVSQLNSSLDSLDVADLVSGGDGSAHRRGNAIDTLTGQAGVLGAVAERHGNGRYHPVPALPVIDGCFVPDGANTANQVDSLGDRFQFPATTNLSYNRIWTGGTIPWTSARGISSVLGDIDYSTPDHSILCIHSNNALTLDLAAIRRLYPDRKISAFQCTVGNSYVNGSSDETATNPRADVFVIVDGSSRFEKQRFTNQDGPFKVDVSLTGNDRFLTLATTDGSDGINDDWILWADTTLRISP